MKYVNREHFADLVYTPDFYRTSLLTGVMKEEIYFTLEPPESLWYIITNGEDLKKKDWSDRF